MIQSQFQLDISDKSDTLVQTVNEYQVANKKQGHLLPSKQLYPSAQCCQAITEYC